MAWWRDDTRSVSQQRTCLFFQQSLVLVSLHRDMYAADWINFRQSWRHLDHAQCRTRRSRKRVSYIGTVLLVWMASVECGQVLNLLGTSRKSWKYRWQIVVIIWYGRIDSDLIWTVLETARNTCSSLLQHPARYNPRPQALCKTLLNPDRSCLPSSATCLKHLQSAPSLTLISLSVENPLGVSYSRYTRTRCPRQLKTFVSSQILCQSRHCLDVSRCIMYGWKGYWKIWQTPLLRWIWLSPHNQRVGAFTWYHNEG